MNERIKQLAEQAGLRFTQLMSNPMVPVVDGKETDLEKFAESIVKECAKYINERSQDWDADLRWIFNDGSGDMAVDVDELLNRHFGVKE
jgi:glycerol-3-phosphate dehydrogenase